jgi:outer membrane protein assembly factor BamB
VWRARTNDPASAVLVGHDISGTNTFSDLNADHGITYFYWVTAKNSVGVSERSAPDTGYQDFTKWRVVANGPIYSAPAVGPDGTVYFGTKPSDYSTTTNDLLKGRLYAIAPDGSTKWEFAVGGNITLPPLVAEDGTIYFGSSEGRLYALDPGGSQKWAFPRGVQTAPALAGDGTIYFGSYGEFYAVHPNGTEFWRFQTSDLISSSAAVGLDGTVYVGTSMAFSML